MSAPTERTLNYGLRYACVFQLNSEGTPNGSGATAYEGLQIQGSTAFELNIPDARKITGLGEDGVTQVAYLPPTESVDGRLNVEAADSSLAAVLDGIKVNSVGELSMLGLATDKQGFEPQVGLMFYQAAKGLVTGKTYWHTFFIPSAQVVRKAPGMSGDKGVTVYQVAPNRVSNHLWGPAFTSADDGYLASQLVEAWSNYPYRVAAYLGTGTDTEFDFPANYPAVQTDGINVFVDDVEVTTGITKAVDGITFDAAPASGARVVVLREIAG